VTWNEAGVNLTNCTIGAGALSLPSFFRATGAVMGCLLLAASALATWFSMLLMLSAAHQVSTRRGGRGGRGAAPAPAPAPAPVTSYEELMEATLGRAGRQFAGVSIVLLQLGCLVGRGGTLLHFSPHSEHCLRITLIS
jgi:hypothetical protein